MRHGGCNGAGAPGLEQRRLVLSLIFFPRVTFRPFSHLKSCAAFFFASPQPSRVYLGELLESIACSHNVRLHCIVRCICCVSCHNHALIESPHAAIRVIASYAKDDGSLLLHGGVVEQSWPRPIPVRGELPSLRIAPLYRKVPGLGTRVALCHCRHKGVRNGRLIAVRHIGSPQALLQVSHYPWARACTAMIQPSLGAPKVHGLRGEYVCVGK